MFWKHDRADSSARTHVHTYAHPRRYIVATKPRLYQGQTEDVVLKLRHFLRETWSLCWGQLDRIDEVWSYMVDVVPRNRRAVTLNFRFGCHGRVFSFAMRVRFLFPRLLALPSRSFRAPAHPALLILPDQLKYNLISAQPTSSAIIHPALVN